MRCWAFFVLFCRPRPGCSSSVSYTHLHVGGHSHNAVVVGVLDIVDAVIPELCIRESPYVTDHEKIRDCIDRIVDSAERSLPVINDSGKLLGIITSADRCV